MSTYIYLRHCSVHQQIKGKNDKFNISGERKVMRPAQLTHGFKWFNAKPETQVVFFFLSPASRQAGYDKTYISTSYFRFPGRKKGL